MPTHLQRILIATLVVSVSAAFAQVTGSVTGAVLDTSGLPMPGVKVALVSEATAATRETATNAEGDFTFSAVPPGRYTLRAEQAGFRVFERRRIELTAGERLSAGPIRMEVGTVADCITVSGQVETVQTASGERSGVITSTEVENLTVINRDFASLVSLMPGVVENPGSEVPGAAGGSGASFNVLGGRTTSNSVTIDGQPTESSLMYSRAFFISMDAISTVRIMVSNYQAEFGRKPGASIQAVTKGGTQQFHGAAYWFKRHEMLNANNFFNNRNKVTPPPYRYVTEGFNLGGPVFIPGLFNTARQRLFFFYSQELLSEKRPQSIIQRNMPTALERAGDFSNSRDLNNRVIPVKDPLAGGRAFPGNVIPISRINKNGQNYLKLLPLPNLSPDLVEMAANRYNWQVQESLEVPKNTETLRLDYNINPKTNVYARWLRWDESATGFAVPAGNVNWGFLPATFSVNTNSLVLSFTRILSPTMVLEGAGNLSVGIQNSRARTQADLERVTRTAAGWDVPQLHPELNPLNLAPQATFGGITNGPSATYESNGRFPFYGNDIIITENASVTKTTGPHTSKAGFWGTRWRQSKGMYGNGTGTFSFNVDTNNPNDSGHPYANALLGNFSSYTESSARPTMRQRQTVVEWFVQDNWKVTRRLTLDLGVRFSWSQPWHTPSPQEEAAFEPSAWNPAKVASLLRPVMSGGKRMAIDPYTGAIYPQAAIGAFVPNHGDPYNGTLYNKTDPSLPRGIRHASGVRPAPRFGFAFDPFGKGRTAIRGGWGYFVDTQEWNGSENSVFRNPPIRIDPIIYYNQFNELINAAAFLFPSATMGYNPARPLARTMNFSFGVQQNVGFGTTVDVSYVGALGRHLIQARNLNSIPFGATFQAQSLDPTTNRALPNAFLYPYTGYNNIMYYAYDGNSNYHSLQTTVNRRFARRVQYGIAWTWSKAMNYVDGDTSAVSMLINRKVWNYGRAGYDRTHIVKASFLWEVPKASRLVRSVVVKHALDDWQVSGIASFVSGAPNGIALSFNYTTDITGSPTDGARVVVLQNPVLPKSERTWNRNFNTDAFGPPAVGTFGNAPKDVIRGPGINNWDISAFKNFHVPWEKIKLQFRGEFYNAFNHTQYSAVDTSARFDRLGNQINTGFGQFTSARQPRRIQLALRATF